LLQSLDARGSNASGSRVSKARITDIVFPIFGVAHTAVAALTVPYVATSFSAARTQEVEDRARAAAKKISDALGQ
jgi:DNA-binding IclR family transcriptional regulator